MVYLSVAEEKVHASTWHAAYFVSEEHPSIRGQLRHVSGIAAFFGRFAKYPKEYGHVLTVSVVIG